MIDATNRENVRQYDQFRENELGGGFIAQGYKMTNAENKLLLDVQRKMESKDPKVGFDAAAKVAGSLKSPGALYVLSALEMQIAGKMHDRGLQSRATDHAVSSGAAPAKLLPDLLRNQAAFALDDGNMAKAEGAYTALVALAPADAESIVTLAQIKADMGKPKEAMPLFDQAIALKKASSQPVPAVWVQAANAVRAKL